jgi:hypothetical protein
MANGGVIVVVSGQDNTEKVFQQIEANLKRVSSQAHETESALSQLGERATKALEYAGIAVGIRETIDLLKDAVKGTLEYGETISKTSEKTGLSAGTLSVLHYAAAVTSSDFDQLSGAVARFDKTIGEAADGNRKAQGFIQALGLNAKDLADRSDGAEIAFKRFAETMAATENPIRRAQLAQDLLGKSGKELIPVLTEVGANFDLFKSKTQEAGLYLDNQSAEALKNQLELYKELQLRIQGVELAFTTGLLPGLDGAVKAFAGVSSSADAWNQVGKLVGKTVLSTVDDFALLVEWVRLAKAEYDSWSSHIDAAGDKVDATIGFTESQRKSSQQKFDNDAQRSKDAAKEYVDAKADYERVHKSVQDSLNNYDQTSSPDSLRHPKVPPFKGVLDEGLDSARKARDAALLKLDEQMAQLRAQLAKASQETALAQLDADHKKNLLSDQDFYAKKLAIEKEALDQQRQAAIDKQAEIDKGIGKLEVDAKKQGGSVAVEDQAKILDLRTKRLALDGEIAKINADAAKAEIAAAQQIYELNLKQIEQADELAAKREELVGGDSAARLKQSADAFGVKRKDLVANFGEGSQQVSDADFAFSNEQGQIRAKSADETSGLNVASINAQRTAIGDAEARGGITTLDAQRQRIALDQEEAQALQPVLEAYRQLAQTGDLEASEKVLELQSRINELKNPVDEVSQHMRDSFDGAFESLFENLDHGVKGFENFAKSIERIFEQAAYKRFLEPLVQKSLGSLIPNAKGPGYGDPGIGGVGPVPNPGTDIGGSVVKSALGGIGGLLGIPGLSGLGKAAGGSAITITLVNNSPLPLDIGSTDTQGNVDKDQVLAIVQNSFDEGGVIRSLLTGFGIA